MANATNLKSCESYKWQVAKAAKAAKLKSCESYVWGIAKAVKAEKIKSCESYRRKLRRPQCAKVATAAKLKKVAEATGEELRRRRRLQRCKDEKLRKLTDEKLQRRRRLQR